MILHSILSHTRCSSGVRIGGGFGKFEPSVASISFGSLSVGCTCRSPARPSDRGACDALGAVSHCKLDRSPFMLLVVRGLSSERATLSAALHRRVLGSEFEDFHSRSRLCPSLAVYIATGPSLSRTAMRQTVVS
ncbi:hypothetical protein Tco_1193264 [Tanacetum coccineum]